MNFLLRQVLLGNSVVFDKKRKFHEQQKAEQKLKFLKERKRKK